MPRGRYKRRAKRYRQEKDQQRLQDAEQRLVGEEARVAEAEDVLREIEALVSEIEALRLQARSVTADQEQELRVEIRELLKVLGQLKAEEVMNTAGQKDMLGGLLFGEGDNDAWLEAFLMECEKRLLERYPDDYTAPEEAITLLRTVPKHVARRIGTDAARIIERSRR